MYKYLQTHWSWPANTTSINKCWCSWLVNATVAISINKRFCQQTADESTIQSTSYKGRIWRHHLAFAVANCLLNRRFATVTVGSCGICWKQRRVAGKARNMTETAPSILIVIFSVLLQQTQISDRKLFIFQHGPIWAYNLLSTKHKIMLGQLGKSKSSSFLCC